MFRRVGHASDDWECLEAADVATDTE
jgi:hypothetical protein